MNHVDPIAVFPSIERMLYNLAWKFSRTYRLPFEDMRSEAYAGFMKACNNYQPKKGMKFSSWCYLVTWGYLKSHIMKRAGDPHRFMEIGDNITGPAPTPANTKLLRLIDSTEKKPINQGIQSLFAEAPAELWEATEGLSSVAEELFCLFWEAPAEILNARTKAEQIEQAKEHLARKHGEKKIRQGYKELRNRLADALAK
jgi:Sigma-70 region 2